MIPVILVGFKLMIIDTKLLTFFWVTWECICSLQNDRHNNGRTDITKLKIAFLNYANARNEIESILKPKQLVGSLSIFKVHQAPDIKGSQYSGENCDGNFVR